MPDEAAIRASIVAYYHANLRGESRERFWVHDGRVIAMHPQGGRQRGWDEIGATERAWPQKRAKWVYKNAELRDMAIHVNGDVGWAAFTVHVELHVPNQEPLSMVVRVSNVYERHGAEWLIVLHHDSITDLDVLQKLQTLQ
jgi:ketosteroid isomerase-like protein